MEKIVKSNEDTRGPTLRTPPNKISLINRRAEDQEGTNTKRKRINETSPREENTHKKIPKDETNKQEMRQYIPEISTETEKEAQTRERNAVEYNKLIKKDNTERKEAENGTGRRRTAGTEGDEEVSKENNILQLGKDEREKKPNPTKDKETGEYIEHEHRTNYSVIQITIKGKKYTKRKRVNHLKIFQYCRIYHKEIEAIRMVTNRMAELIPKSEERGRDIWRGLRETDQENFSVWIPRRNQERWGVIQDWTPPIEELVEEMDPGQGNVRFERLKKRVKIEGGFEWRDTEAILAKFEGNSLPTKVSVYGGMFGLRVQPYIWGIKQCNNCLKYGHLKRDCRAKKRCFICSMEFHGQCEQRPFCVNCGEGHGALSRKCKIYQMESLTNKIIAYKNTSREEANKIAKIELGMTTMKREQEEEGEYDRMEDKEFPTLGGTRRKIKIERWEDKPLSEIRNDWEEKKEKELEKIKEEESKKAYPEEKTGNKQGTQENHDNKKRGDTGKGKENEKSKEQNEEKLLQELIELIKASNMEEKLRKRLEDENKYKKDLKQTDKESEEYRPRRNNTTNRERNQTYNQNRNKEEQRGLTLEERNWNMSPEYKKEVTRTENIPQYRKPTIKKINIMEEEEKIKLERIRIVTSDYNSIGSIKKTHDLKTYTKEQEKIWEEEKRMEEREEEEKKKMEMEEEENKKWEKKEERRIKLEKEIEKEEETKHKIQENETKNEESNEDKEKEEDEEEKSDRFISFEEDITEGEFEVEYLDETLINEK